MVLTAFLVALFLIRINRSRVYNVPKQQLVFEENFLCNGFTPTIAVATHKKPNCQPTCIDNILVNNADDVIRSGAIETHISHHRSIFIHMSLPPNNNVRVHRVNKIKNDTLKYDSKVENLDRLLLKTYIHAILIPLKNSQPCF